MAAAGANEESDERREVAAQKVVVQLPELRRILPDALRVMGVPPGLAPAAAEVLLWSMATTPTVVRWLRRHRSRMLWEPRPRPAVIESRPGSAVIDGRGSNLLDAGLGVLDFCVAETSRQTRFEAQVIGCFGEVFLPYMERRAAYMGTTVHASIREPTNGTPRSVHLDCLCGRNDGDDRFEQVDQLVRSANKDGIALDSDDFAFIMGQFEMLRVPTSERSRSHAG